MHLLRSAALLGALVSPELTSQTGSPGLPSPKDFLGKEIGADRFLADYSQLRAYWHELDRRSDRLHVERIGTTSYGQPMLMAVISAPANLRERERYRQISVRLCRARGLDDATAKALAEQGKSVIWIDAGMHATESVAAQNIIELVWRMVSRQDAETREILENVILLVCPANPDGMEMIAKGYMATGTVGRLPVLYQRYVGHDNNRDFYMSSMPETEAINRILYRHWKPQVIYNHHQSAPRGTILFTPPFRDPFNYNFDPMLVRGIDLVATHINNRFSWEQKPGIISRSGARYSTWWNGGLRTTAYFHNMIGILTEAYGHPTPRRLDPDISRRLPKGDYPDPVAGGMWHARQTIEYLQTANQAILLLAARYRKEMLYNIYQMGRNSIRRGQRDHWTVTPRLIAEARRRGKEGQSRTDLDAGTDALEGTFTDPALRDPRGYLLSILQPDQAGLRRFVATLIKNGVEVQRLTTLHRVDGQSFAAGSFLVSAAQAFRPHVRDMFEPQWHPDDIGKDGKPVGPYDSAGWTLAMHMGLQVHRVYESVPLQAEQVTLDRLLPPGADLPEGPVGYLWRPGDGQQFNVVQELLRKGEKVYRLSRALRQKFPWDAAPLGAFYLPATARVRAALGQRGIAPPAEDLSALATGALFGQHGITPLIKGLDGARALQLKPVRIGLFDPYGGHMATGWTRWTLERHGFTPELLLAERVHQGDLHEDFDVLIFHTGLPDPGGPDRVRRALRRGRPNLVSDEHLEKLRKALPAFEDWSTADARRQRLDRKLAVPQLEAFMKRGGTVIALGQEAVDAAGLFAVPVREGVLVEDGKGGRRRATRSEFFIPGSLIQVRRHSGHLITTGVPQDPVVMFRRSPVLRVLKGDQLEVLLSYPQQGELLRSGWAIGEDRLRGLAAAIEVPRGDGKLYLFAADLIYRGQGEAGMKLVLNAVQLAGAQAVRIPAGR